MLKSNKILIPIFCLVVVAQLFVPVKMILDREDIIETGTVYKFKTAPVDPTDLFRGKYITLNFDADEFVVDSLEQWEDKKAVFVGLGVDTLGFAKIVSVSDERPSETLGYVEAERWYSNTVKNKPTIFLRYPFDRFYMEESKAPKAEKAYRNVRQDSTQTAYAIVCIKNGEAVLTDVMINDVSIKEFVKDADE